MGVVAPGKKNASLWLFKKKSITMHGNMNLKDMPSAINPGNEIICS